MDKGMLFVPLGGRSAAFVAYWTLRLFFLSNLFLLDLALSTLPPCNSKASTQRIKGAMTCPGALCVQSRACGTGPCGQTGGTALPYNTMTPH